MKNLCFKLLPGLVILMLFCHQAYAQAPTATVSPITNTTCGLNNGAATVNPAGGNGSYTYRWSTTPVATTASVTGLPSGAYTVTVYSGIDSIVKNFNIGSSTAPTVVITATRDTLCVGSADTLTATASGPGGTYTWSGGTLGSPITGNPIYISSISPGAYSYSVTWTDAGGICSASNTYADSIRYIFVKAAVSRLTQPACGGNNGIIEMGITALRYVCTFYLNNTIIQNGTSPTCYNLRPGVYKFILTDLATGCSAEVDNITLVDNSTTPVFSSIVIDPETCFGNKNGAIFVTVGNCAGTCGYTWSYSSANNTDSATKLAAGSYTLSVNSGGCSNIDTTIIVPGPTAALLDTLRVHTDHCNHAEGSAIVLSHGGTPPYSYVWTAGTPATSAGDSVSNIRGFSRDTVIVMDSHGCTDTLSDSIGNTPGPSAHITNKDTICSSESNGVLIVKATSNDGPFTYSWSSGSTSPVAGGLVAGGYTVVVTNAVGCDTTLTAQVYAYVPYINLGAIPNGLYLGQTTELLVTTPVPVRDVRWDPYVPGSAGSLEVYDKPEVTTKYFVTVDYGLACQLIDSALVTVLIDTTPMRVPNTFTPNGDGTNDIFHLLDHPSLKSFHFWVYDRWGNKVYETTDESFQWDGTDIFAANKPLNTGVLTYTLEYAVFDSPDKKTIGGNITLVK